MALSIVPVLLSLLPSPPAGDLLVHVVDKDGKPVAGVQIALGSRMETHGHFPPQEMFFVLQKTEAVTGCTSFTDLSRFVHPNEHTKYFARLGVPGLSVIEGLLEADKLPAELTLTLPECGQVLLRTPCKGKGTAQLRLAPDPSGPPPFWRSRQPPGLELAGGVARFEHVGLGAEFEYRVNSPELPTELRGTFKGPTKPGQTVEFTVKGLEGSPTLLATLVGGDLKPIGDLQIDWSIGISKGNSSNSSGGRVRSDDKGRVRIPLVGAHAESGARQLSINAWSDDASAKRLGKAYAGLAIPPEFHEGECDLGELILVPFGSAQRFMRLDDEALKRAFEAPREGMSMRPSNDAGNPLEELLCEMVRRGGAGWEAYVAQQLAAVRAEQDPLGWHRVGELELLTALRRLQHKPDPLVLMIKSESKLDVRFPESPMVLFDWKNVDSGDQSFEMADGGSYRSGRFARCSVEATGPGKRKLPPREWGSGFGGGMFSNEKLAPGETLSGGIELGNFVRLDAPGEYRVRLHYHDKEDIDSLEDLTGRFVSSSEEFVVHVLPREIPVTQARLDETRAWVQQIDKQKRIPLVSGHWHADMAFSGAATDPEDKLFRAGYEALPALFEALEDKALAPERRAWVLGMLWNILGLENPVNGMRYSALGNSAWVKKWPTSTEEAPFNFGESGESFPTPIDPAQQAELADAWRKWKSLIEVKIVP